MLNPSTDKEEPMTKFRVIILTVFFVGLAGMAQADAPNQVGGFVLGQDIKKFEDRVIMDTALPVRYAENFKEVEIKFTKGFKSGLIGYGTCEQPGHIVRIKLKYADSSKKFYKKLLKRFKQRFGEPDEYRGDPFKIVDAWKWSFTNQQNQSISLTLQHNTKDEEEFFHDNLRFDLGTSKFASLTIGIMECWNYGMMGLKKKSKRIFLH